jgi:hypothetical protein
MAAKCETTAGADAVPTAGSNAIKVYGLEFSPLGKGSSLDRRSRVSGHWSGLGNVSGLRAGTVKCSVHVAASGTQGEAPAFGPLLVGCGLKQTVDAGNSVTYSTTSAASLGAWSATTTKSGWCPLTIYIWQGDTAGGASCKLYKFTGCAGKIRFSAQFGKTLVASMEFQGVYGEPTITTMPSPTFVAMAEPLSLTAQAFQVSTDGATWHEPVLTSMDLDIGSKVVMRERIGATSGFVSAEHAGRNPTVKLTVEEPKTFTAATGFDWWDCWESNTQIRVNTHAIQLDGSSGNITRLNVPRITLKTVERQGGDGVAMYSLSATCDVVEPTTGDDEFTLMFA